MNRFANIGLLLCGLLTIALCTRDLLQHQYAFIDRLWPGDPKEWAPTSALLFGGVWLFLMGLLGLVRAKTKQE
jgi:hypothetical protein